MIPRPLRIATISWPLLLASTAAAWCAEDLGREGDETGRPPLAFRRMYVPSDRTDQWPTGSAEYWPVAPAEFERLLQAARVAGAPARSERLPHLVRAEYEARLVGGRWLEGRASLVIEHPGPWAALMPLSPCGLAVREASWGGEPPMPAKVGATGDSALKVLVAQSGRLELDWSLAGSQDASGEVRFAMDLPPCPVSRLWLALPEGTIPKVDRGIVVAAGTGDGPVRRWGIELGPHHRVRLRLVSADANPRPRQTRLWESLVYDLSLHGLNLAAQWKLEVLHQALSEVALRLDSELELASVRYGDVPVPWSEQQTEGGRRVVVELPEAVSGTGRVLHLRALAPLRIDRPWTLPRIHPEQLDWQEGTISLLVPKPLVLRDLVPTGCQQTDAAPLASPREGESAHFRCYRPDATLAVELGRREAPLEMSSGTTVRLGSEEATAEVLADFRLAEGARFVLEADVAEGWLIDAVESTPAGLIDSSPILGRGPNRRLEVRLAKGLSASQPVKLRIAARRFHSRGDLPFALAELVPLKFRAADHELRLVALEPVGPYRLETAGADDLHRVERQSLDASAAKLFSQPPRGLVFKNDTHAAGLQIDLRSERPTYRAELQVEAAVTGTILRESYVLRCVPDGARVEQVLVHFCCRREVSPRFSLPAENDQQLSSRRLTAEEQSELGLSAEGETWQVRLRRPRRPPFEIHAAREMELGQGQPISLVTLPEAGDQQGTLVIRSLGGGPLKIVNRRLDPVPAETLPVDEAPTVRAAFRYDPTGEAAGVTKPAVTVAPNPTPTTSASCIWSCQLESRYQGDGPARHLATYRIRSAGGGTLRLVLPPGTSLKDVHGAWVDGRQASFRPAAGGLSVALPAGRRFPTVTIDFSTARTALGTWGKVEPPMPEPELPVLAAQWTVWLPPGFEAYGPQTASAARLSWTQRLFGPLGRPVGREAFDVAGADWLQIARARNDRLRDLRRAEQLIAAVGSLVGEGGPGEPDRPASWAELLGHRVIEPLAPVLVLDRPALARLGIGPDSPLPRVDGDTASERGTRLLEQAELALLFSDTAVVLTGRRQALLEQTHLEPLARAFVYQVLPGPLAGQIREAVSGGPEGVLVSRETWSKPPSDPQPYWNVHRIAGFRASDSCGWNAYRLDTPVSGPAEVGLRYLHEPTVRLLGWVALLLTIGLGWWTLAGRPLWLLTTAGLLGCLSLLLPKAYVPITSGVVVGLLFCLARELIRRRAPAGPVPEPSTPTAASPSTSSRVWLVLAVLGSLTVSTSKARGQAPEVSPPKSEPEVYRVFIPVDEDRKPTGGRYHVPEALYRELLRRADAGEAPHGWLIGSATYRGALSRDVSSERFMVEQLRGSYRLRVFKPGIRVRLPLRGGRPNLVHEGALLDGVAIRPEWESSGGVLTFQVPEAGPHELELRWRPTRRAGPGPDGFDLDIPPSATSRLELRLPPGAPVVEVPSALGLVRTEEDASRLVAELGPVDRLSVIWSDGAGAAARASVEVEELLWLRVQPEPGTTVIDAKLIFSFAGREMKRVRLALDPRLRLLELRGKNPPKAETKTGGGQEAVIELRWPEPVRQTAIVEASLLLSQNSGVGRLSLPRFEVLDCRSVRRWLAVSLDPMLERVGEEGPAEDVLAVPQFLAKWGEHKEAPQFAWQIPSDGPPWGIATRPRNSQTTARQTVVLSFDEGFADVRMDAELDTTAGYHFQHRLAVPTEFDVEQVSVREEDVERVVRWSVDGKGRVVVFLSGPVTGPHRLELRGRWRTDELKQPQLPAFTIEGTQLESSTVEIYRRPAALVAPVQIAPGVGIERAPDGPDDAELGRLVARLRSNGGEPVRAALLLATNRPSVRGDQLVRLVPQAGSWTAELDCRVEVDQGLLDEIVLDVPATFGGPYRLTADPPAELTHVERPENRRRLILRPPSPIAVGYQFRLSSPLALERGKRPEAPDVTWVGTAGLRQLVSLPMREGERSLGWETRGLKPTPLPDGFLPPADAAAFTTFEVVGRPYAAVLRPAPPGAHQTRVTLADVHLAWRADGTLHGVAAFDLQPGSSSTCVLDLPPRCQLIQATVAGLPGSPSPAGPHRYVLSLGPKWLPQRIELVFSGTLSRRPGAGPARFEAPWLGDLPVEQTLWTVSGPALVEPEEPIHGKPRGRWRHDLLRLQTIAQSIETAAAGEVDHRTTRNWYRRWVRRLAATRAALLRQLHSRAGLSQAQTVRARIREVDQAQSRLAARLGTSDLLAECYADPRTTEGSTELWRQSFPGERRAARYSFHKAAPSLTVGYRRAEEEPLALRAVAAVGLVLVVALTAWTLRRGLLCRWFYQWPALFGVALGLAWWLWLFPSLLGWGIVLGSLVAALVSAWRRSTVPPGSSVIALRSLPRLPAAEK